MFIYAFCGSFRLSLPQLHKVRLTDPGHVDQHTHPSPIYVAPRLVSVSFVGCSGRSMHLLPVAELGGIINAHISVLPDSSVGLLCLRLSSSVRVLLQEEKRGVINYTLHSLAVTFQLTSERTRGFLMLRLARTYPSLIRRSPMSSWVLGSTRIAFLPSASLQFRE